MIYEDATTLRGSHLRDPLGDKVGRITDVITDASTRQPSWAVVSRGMLAGHALVPVTEIYNAEDGTVVTTLHRDVVKHAPKVDAKAPDVSASERYYH